MITSPAVLVEYPEITGSVVLPSVIATVATPIKCIALERPNEVRNVSAVNELPRDTSFPAIVTLELVNLLLAIEPANIALVTLPLPIVVAMDQPAYEETVPVISPVKVIDCAEANLVAVAALPSKAP